jgi:hypothetical protein
MLEETHGLSISPDSTSEKPTSRREEGIEAIVAAGGVETQMLNHCPCPARNRSVEQSWPTNVNSQYKAHNLCLAEISEDSSLNLRLHLHLQTALKRRLHSQPTHNQRWRISVLMRGQKHSRT